MVLYLNSPIINYRLFYQHFFQSKMIVSDSVTLVSPILTHSHSSQKVKFHLEELLILGFNFKLVQLQKPALLPGE